VQVPPLDEQEFDGEAADVVVMVVETDVVSEVVCVVKEVSLPPPKKSQNICKPHSHRFPIVP